jgi:hypothetical protein
MSAEPLYTAEGEERPSRYPIPDGYMTPAEFCHLLRAKNIADFLPQYVYGWIKKPGSGFPYDINLDGRRIVPVDDGVNWIVRYLQARAEKEAMKAAAAAHKAEAAAEAAGMITIPEIEPEDEWNEWDGEFK